ncbi:Probable glutathione S-transferase [Linum grandiflorum]
MGAKEEEEEEEVKLFKTWSSLFALRVVWALKLKGIPYESFDEDLANKSNTFLNYNPVHKKVPVLIHNGTSISESLVILEYIDETWDHNPPAFFPKDPLQRAAARFWSKFGDETMTLQVLPSVWKAFTTIGKEHEQELAATVSNLKLLEEELKGKEFFCGEEFGIVDMALGWVVNLVPVYEDILGFKVLDC